MNKNDALANLISQRREEKDPKYHHLKYFEGGFYDCEFVVPWTISGCNLDSDLMILAQDWASESFLKKRSKPAQKELRRRHGQDADLPTNKNLKALLKKHFDLEFSDVYATDVFVFIKSGHMSAPIPIGDLEYSAKNYTLPQIKIVQPRMVLCLGAKTFNALRGALGQREMKLSEACLPTHHTVYEGAEIYGVPHTGNWGTKNAGGIDSVHRVWEKLAARLTQLTGSPRQLKIGQDDAS